MNTPIDTEMLRSVVRDVLRELVGEVGERAASAAPAMPARVEEVRIATDADLAAFARRLAELCADARTREAIGTGKHVFRLRRDGTAAPVASAAVTHSSPGQAPAKAPAHRIAGEVLSEAKVVSLAKANRRIVLGRGAVVTPLARDKARQLGLVLEREK